MEEKSLWYASQALLTGLQPHCLGASSRLQPAVDVFSACRVVFTVWSDVHSREGQIPSQALRLSCSHVPRQCCPPLLPMFMWPLWGRPTEPQPAPNTVLPFWERHSCWQISAMVLLASWHALEYKYYLTGIVLNVNNSVQDSHGNKTLLSTEGTVERKT